jgi:hypothetical protein
VSFSNVRIYSNISFSKGHVNRRNAIEDGAGDFKAAKNGVVKT